MVPGASRGAPLRSLASLLAACCLLGAAADTAAADEFPPPPGAVEALAVAPSGAATILVRADAGGPAFVARLGGDGRLDPGFAGDGLLTLPTPAASSLAVAADGSLAVGSNLQSDRLVPGVGYATSGRIGRYTAAGATDPGFGGDGTLELTGGTVERLFFQPGGRLVSLSGEPCRCGYAAYFVHDDLLAPDGRLIHRSVAGSELFELQAAAIAADGSLVVLGQIRDLRTSLLYRFLPSGRLDRRLGGREGLAIYPSNPNFEQVSGARDLALAPGGSIYVATRRGLSRRRPSGRADRRFGGGQVSCEVTQPSYGAVRTDLVAVAPGGEVLGAGGYGRCGISRYLATGQPDSTFGAEGRVDVEALGLPRPQALAVAADGSVLVAAWDKGSRNLRLARFTPAGVLDPAYASAGVATLAAPPG